MNETNDRTACRKSSFFQIIYKVGRSLQEFYDINCDVSSDAEFQSYGVSGLSNLVGFLNFTVRMEIGKTSRNERILTIGDVKGIKYYFC